jgi:hypothetical protein
MNTMGLTVALGREIQGRDPESLRDIFGAERTCVPNARWCDMLFIITEKVRVRERK